MLELVIIFWFIVDTHELVFLLIFLWWYGILSILLLPNLVHDYQSYIGKLFISNIRWISAIQMVLSWVACLKLNIYYGAHYICSSFSVRWIIKLYIYWHHQFHMMRNRQMLLKFSNIGCQRQGIFFGIDYLNRCWLWISDWLGK